MATPANPRPPPCATTGNSDQVLKKKTSWWDSDLALSSGESFAGARAATAAAKAVDTAVYIDEWLQTQDARDKMGKLSTLKGLLYSLLATVDSVLGAKNISWAPAWGTLLGCVRHGTIIPWGDDIDILVLEQDLPQVLHACNAAGLSTREVFFGVRIFPKPGAMHFIDVFACHSATAADLKASSRGQHGLYYSKLSQGDMILGSDAREVFKWHISQSDWGPDGLRHGTISLRQPNTEAKAEASGDFLTCLGFRDTGSLENLPPALLCSSFMNPHGHLDQLYGPDWVTVGKIAPTDREFCVDFTASQETVVKFRADQLAVSKSKYAQVYEEAKGKTYDDSHTFLKTMDLSEGLHRCDEEGDNQGIQENGAAKSVFDKIYDGLFG